MNTVVLKSRIQLVKLDRVIHTGLLSVDFFSGPNFVKEIGQRRYKRFETYRI